MFLLIFLKISVWVNTQHIADGSSALSSLGCPIFKGNISIKNLRLLHLKTVHHSLFILMIYIPYYCLT